MPYYPPQGGYPPPSGYPQQGGFPPQGGYPPYGAPPQQQFSPQPGYQQPPPGQYPPQGASPYPPQGSRSLYPQQPYQGGPPQPPRPMSNLMGPPMGALMGAPMGGPGYPPAYGTQPPSQVPYGGPPQTPYPTPPSPGYGPSGYAPMDTSMPADELRRAMKGLGTDETALIRVLSHFPATGIAPLKATYQQRHNRSVEKDVASETSSYFKLALTSILRGPLEQDVWLLNNAIKGLGTKESMLNDVLLSRSNADMNIIKQTYQRTYNRSLEADVKGDLSLKTERLFSMVLAATRQEDSAPVLTQSVEADVAEIHRATEARLGTDQITVCAILTNRSDGQLRAIASAYEQRYRLTLETIVGKEFSGHMKQALVQIVRKAVDPAMKEAVALEEAMAGAGTKDELLVSRVVKLHWDRDQVVQVRGAYKHRYGKDLVNRVRGETSGDYMRLLTAMLE
ncbi:hypothetical protein MMC25_002020 [Agyrium rufum]|nr:hypothetical protein [Agyrium rufum]